MGTTKIEVKLENCFLISFLRIALIDDFGVGNVENRVHMAIEYFDEIFENVLHNCVQKYCLIF